MCVEQRNDRIHGTVSVHKNWEKYMESQIKLQKSKSELLIMLRTNFGKNRRKNKNFAIFHVIAFFARRHSLPAKRCHCYCCCCLPPKPKHTPFVCSSISLDDIPFDGIWHWFQSMHSGPHDFSRVVLFVQFEISDRLNRKHWYDFCSLFGTAVLTSHYHGYSHS